MSRHNQRSKNRNPRRSRRTYSAPFSSFSDREIVERKNTENKYAAYICNPTDLVGCYNRQHFYKKLLFENPNDTEDTSLLGIGQIFYSFLYGDTPLVVKGVITSYEAKKQTKPSSGRSQKRMILASKSNNITPQRNDPTTNPEPKKLGDRDEIMLYHYEVSEIIPEDEALDDRYTDGDELFEVFKEKKKRKRRRTVSVSDGSDTSPSPSPPKKRQ